MIQPSNILVINGSGLRILCGGACVWVCVCVGGGCVFSLEDMTLVKPILFMVAIISLHSKV